MPPSSSSACFKAEGRRRPTLEETAATAAYYRERGMAAVILTVDAESATGTENEVRPRILKENAARLHGLTP